MGELSQGSQEASKPSEGRLDSWKEIASYLHRDVTTVQRWERREGMPVHRHLHDKAGSVYAYSSELDAWQKSRKQKLGELEPEGEAQPQPQPQVPTLSAKKQVFHGQAWVFLSGFVVALLLTIIIAMSGGHAKQPQIRSLAVLPLKNLSGDPTQDYLVDGMTEALISRLSRIHDLRVISRTSVTTFKDTKLSLPEIAKTLQVDAIVEGSVIRDGSRIRVHAQLIRGATDEHFWSEEYEREVRDVLALESDVAQSIARKVEVTLTGKERQRLAATHPVSPEVYESFLRAQDQANHVNSGEDLEKAITDFNDTISKDPNFAPAYVGLASMYQLQTTSFASVPPQEVRPKLISAARKALELDPDLVRPYILLGEAYQRQWQWSDAEAELKRALELGPNDAMAQEQFAIWLLCQGRTDEALTWIQRAREIDPLGHSAVSNGFILFHARRYDEAVRELRSVEAAYPDHWYLGFALIANDQPDEAVKVLEKALSSERTPTVMGVLVRAYARAGRRADAVRLLDELKRRQQKTYIPSAAFINAYLGLGDNEQALNWLDRAYQERSNMLQLIKVHPYFDPLRDDPRFKDLVHKVGLD
jgi:TolB-like protein/Flp pilus assembly protein TadD